MDGVDSDGSTKPDKKGSIERDEEKVGGSNDGDSSGHEEQEEEGESMEGDQFSFKDDFDAGGNPAGAADVAGLVHSSAASKDASADQSDDEDEDSKAAQSADRAAQQAVRRHLESTVKLLSGHLS